MGLMAQLFQWLYGLIDNTPIRLAIVRRYADANGNYVGELYIERTRKGISGYDMIGMALDSLPLDQQNVIQDAWTLDTRHDFLEPMPMANVIRVGALEPKDNDSVRRMMAALPRRRMSLVIQNRFIEHIMEKRNA